MSTNGYNMSLFFCQSFIRNINITPAREMPPATSGEAGCPVLSSFYQNGVAAPETLVRYVGPWRSTLAQVRSFRPIQVLWEGVSSRPDLFHLPVFQTSCESSGRMGSIAVTCKTSFHAAYTCFFLS